MLIFTESIDSLQANQKVNGELVLPFEIRQKGRIKATSVAGEEVGIQLPRGKVLRHRQYIKSEDGVVYQILAEQEQVSTVYCKTSHDLARVCYHLGNRHVPLQVDAQWCRYLHDHVLDDMVKHLGATVEVGLEIFEPESGAYVGSGQGHGHSHDHSHGHTHSHSHSHSHLAD